MERSRFYNPYLNANIAIEVKNAFKRSILKRIYELIHENRVVLLNGPIGIGKTTILKQLIGMLLDEGIDTSRIYYLPLDDEVRIEDGIRYYEESVLSKKLVNIQEPVYIFLDEIEYDPQWRELISKYISENENLKFILTASYLQYNIPENIVSITIKPLSFREYLSINGIHVDKVEFEMLELRKKYIEYLDLSSYFQKYLKTGGIPSLALTPEDGLTDKIRNDILNRIIYMLIPRLEKRKEPYLIEKILKYITYAPGSHTNYNSLSASLNKDIRTVINYFEIADRAFLTYKLRNKIAERKSSRKLPKTYPYLPSYAWVFYPDKFNDDAYVGKLIEGFLALYLNAKFYWRKGSKEVSLLWDRDGEEIPVIVNYIKRLSRREIKKMDTTLKKINKNFGVVIAKDTLEFVKRERELWIMPPWLLMLTLD